MTNLHCKELQRIYSVLLLNSTANDCFRNLQWIAGIFYIYFCQILWFFYSVKCKILRYTVNDIVKYRDFFNR